MTVSSEQSFIEYNGDGATQTFTVPFYFILNSDISVTVADASGNLDELTYGVDFSASGGGNPDGGTATLNTAYASGYTILIYRNPPETQETAYYENGKFPAKSHEKALDKLTMLIQKYGWWFDSLALKKPSYLAQYYDAQGNRISNLADPVNVQDAATKGYSDTQNGKALRVPELVNPLPNAATRAGKLVAFDNAGNPIVVLPASGSASDVMIQLGSNDGEKYIGECPTIATLRTIEPSFDRQRITVREHTAGTGYGGGQFRAVIAGGAYTDNNGTIIKTTAGAAWLRVNADVVNPLMFGAVPRVDDTTPSAHTAITNAHRAATGKLEGLGYTYNINGETLFDSSTPKINEDLRLYSIAAANVANIIRVQNSAHRLNKIIIYGNSTPLAIGISHSSTAASAVIENCTVFDCGRNGILAAGYGIKIRNNRTVNCGYAGTGNFRCSIQINEAEHSIIEGNESRDCVWGILIRNEIGVTQGYFNTMRNNIVISKSGNVADAQGVSASAQYHLTTTGNIVRNFPNNGIDHQNCFGMIISDNQIVSCNDGIFIGDRSCGRILITNNNIEGCITGVRFYNPAGTAFPGNTFADVSISRNSIFQSTTYGIWVPMDGESSSNWLICVDSNIVEGQGAGGRGIRMSSVTQGSCSGNVVRRVNQHGIDLSSCDNMRVVNNTILDAGFGTTGTYNGINAATCSRLTLTGNAATGASMVYAVNVSGGSQNIIDSTISRSLSGSTAVNVSSSTGTITGTLLIKG